MKNKPTLSCMMLALLFSISITMNLWAAQPQRPNIILIMSDDMGWSDLGCYGGEIHTPNLDSLSNTGLRFTQFYNTARCCPTRACLLTGLYPHQAGMGHMTIDHGEDGYRGDLNKQCVTIAEVLHDAGYSTYAIGKWHVTRFDGPEGPKHNWPLQRGFDKYYGLIWGISSFYDPAICRGNTFYSRENDPEYKTDNFYFTEAMSDNAVMFLKQHEKKSPDTPFFMYVAYTAAHWPMHALEKDIAKYRGKYDLGYDAIRKARIERLKKLGLIDPSWTPTPTQRDWDKVEYKDWEIRCMEVYAAMIDNMDQGIGKIVAELKRQNSFDNTLIFFLQDNGACAEEIGRQVQTKTPESIPPLKPNELPASGHPQYTREGKPILHGPGIMPGGPDTYLAYGLGWANVSNTPFREYKHWVHEGGISTPLIVHWPAGIAESRNNSLVKDSAHLIDIMATCVDIAGAKYPEQYKDEKITPMQGISLRPTFTGKALDRKEPIFWEHESNRAVRDGKWKLVAKNGQPWELYDMNADRTEMNNLAHKHPDRVKEMAARWDAWAAQSKVLPLGTWKIEPDPPTKRRVFELKQGDELLRDMCPVVRERTVIITAEILEHGKDGVIIAQGGLAHGYSLYMKEGKLYFAIRRDNKLTTIKAQEPLPPAPVSVDAIIEKNGAIRLAQGGKTLAFSPSGGPLMITPIDGLSVGWDMGHPVGNYKGAFLFKGKIKKVIVDTRQKKSQ